MAEFYVHLLFAKTAANVVRRVNSVDTNYAWRLNAIRILLSLDINFPENLQFLIINMCVSGFIFF